MLGRALNAFLSIMSLGPANSSQMVTIYYSYFAHEETEAQVIHSSKVKTKNLQIRLPRPLPLDTRARANQTMQECSRNQGCWACRAAAPG